MYLLSVSEFVSQSRSKSRDSAGASYNPSNPDENCVADLGLPSPGTNSDTLNRYYADQSPLISELTGGSGPSDQVDPTVTNVNTTGQDAEEATGRTAAVDTETDTTRDSQLATTGPQGSNTQWGTLGGDARAAFQGITRSGEGTATPAGGLGIPDDDPSGLIGGGSGGGTPPF